jgi:hypothetical protein
MNPDIQAEIRDMAAQLEGATWYGKLPGECTPTEEAAMMRAFAEGSPDPVDYLRSLFDIHRPPREGEEGDCVY